MIRKNSYAIAALLITVVPFATGCEKPCPLAKELRNDTETLSDILFDVSQDGNLDPVRCAALIAAANSLNNKSDLAKIKDWASDKGTELRRSADRVRRVAPEIATRIGVICGSNRAGLGEVASGVHSYLRKKNTREVVDLIELELVTSGEPIILKACGKEATKHQELRKRILASRARSNAAATMPAVAGARASSAPVVAPPSPPEEIRVTDSNAAPARPEAPAPSTSGSSSSNSGSADAGRPERQRRDTQ